MEIHKLKKKDILKNIYKMIVISKELWEENGMEVIVDKYGIKWGNEKHIGNDHSALRSITSKYPSKYRKQRQELANCNNYQPCSIFLHKKVA